MIFTLNKNEKIIIDLSYSIEEILPFDPISIRFSSEATVKLAKNHILPTLREFKIVLKKAIDKESTWPDKINEDIGCIWNKVLKDDIPDENIVLLQGETVKYWSGILIYSGFHSLGWILFTVDTKYCILVVFISLLGWMIRMWTFNVGIQRPTLSFNVFRVKFRSDLPVILKVSSIILI